MIKKNLLIVSILIICFTLFSFNATYAVKAEGEGVSDESIVSGLRANQTQNPFEMTLSELTLKVGDTIMEWVIFVFNDDITIDRIVFNKIISLDPNFFKYNTTAFATPTTEIFCSVINEWYQLFFGVAIIAYLILLVGIGVKILLRQCFFKSGSKRFTSENGLLELRF